MQLNPLYDIILPVIVCTKDFFMKKLIFILCAFLLSIGCTGCRKQYDFVSSQYAVMQYSSHAFVYDYSDGSVRKMSGTGDDRVYPASITKLLTALTALDMVSPDTLISPGAEVYLPSEGSSGAYIRPHHTLTLEMLIEGMLLPSGNDAAYAIAAYCGKIDLDMSGLNEDFEQAALDAFLLRMNAYASSLGCVGSRFTVPDGYAGKENYSTIDDMILICRAAAENPVIAKYAAMESDDVVYASGHTNTWVNTNRMLDPESVYYNKNIMGLKTGSLEDYYSLVALYDDGEKRLLIGVFGSERENDRYRDVLNLIEAEQKTDN